MVAVFKIYERKSPNLGALYHDHGRPMSANWNGITASEHKGEKGFGEAKLSGVEETQSKRQPNTQ